jgi:hypothetical protein
MPKIGPIGFGRAARDRAPPEEGLAPRRDDGAGAPRQGAVRKGRNELLIGLDRVALDRDREGLVARHLGDGAVAEIVPGRSLWRLRREEGEGRLQPRDVPGELAALRIRLDP